MSRRYYIHPDRRCLPFIVSRAHRTPLAGRADVPVYLGRETPRGAHNPFPADWRTMSDRMTGLSLPASPHSPERRSAAEFLAERLRDPSRPVDVLALGAHTNLAEALERQPRLAAVRSLVIMGGAVDKPSAVKGTIGV